MYSQMANFVKNGYIYSVAHFKQLFMSEFIL